MYSILNLLKFLCFSYINSWIFCFVLGPNLRRLQKMLACSLALSVSKQLRVWKPICARSILITIMLPLKTLLCLGDSSSLSEVLS